MEAADNKEPFENQWRQAFDQASVSPPAMVWAKIEATLATQKEGIYKKAIFYYQFAAAAMATIAVGLAVALYVNDGETSPADYRIASESVNYQEMRDADAASTKNGQHEMQEDESEVALAERQSEVGATGEAKTDDRMKAVPPAGIAEREEERLPGADLNSTQLAANEVSEGDAVVEQMGVPRLSSRAVADMPSNVEVLQVAHLYGVARPVIRSRGAREDQPLLASIGVGAGSFDPNYSFRPQGAGFMASSLSGSRQEAVSLAPAGAETMSDQFNYSNGLVTQNARGYNESYSQGGTFSFGAGVGKRFFKKLLVHAGLYYGRFNSSGSTNLVLNDSINDRRYAVNQSSLYNEEVQDVYASGNYSYRSEATALTNTYEFLTVPLKAGYILLDGRTGLVLNAGISSEMFLSNLVNPEGSGIESTKTKPGADSPYRNVYFNGTLGVEVNYQIASNYKVVLEPYYRHALTTFTKNTEGLTSSPRIWGIQAGLRYELR